MSSQEEARAEREKKVALLRAAGMDPYTALSNRTHTIKELIEFFDAIRDSKEVVIVGGRVMALRLHGGSAFLDLFDGTERIQAFFSKDVVSDAAFELLRKTIDGGDFIEVRGTTFMTERGARAIAVTEWKVLTKALEAIPSEWYGIKDEDERYRKRYLDILVNGDTRDIVYKRAKFWQTIRKFLIERDFLEVETPVLENTPGGAEARPFITHHNALDIDVFLRISAGELWQKKLMVAGIPKTFEIGRIFRNEGMSAEHLQDYTQLEFYEAYSDYTRGMALITDLYREIATEVFGTTKFSIRGFDVDLGTPWQTYDYCALLQNAYGIDVLHTTLEEVMSTLTKEEIAFNPNDINVERGVDLLWKKIRKGVAGPGFLINVPVMLEPLAKRSSANSEVVERFQVLIAGSEIGKGFSELNDPVDQRERFMKQQAMRDAGDEEAQMADMEYVEALEYGMPPTFGFGLSERLFAFLMDKPARETQIFPLMRPKQEEVMKNKKAEAEVAVIVVDRARLPEDWQILNTVAHLAASFAARTGRKLFSTDHAETKDANKVRLNIRNAIVIKEGSNLNSLATGEYSGCEVYPFTREMIETTNDKKIIEGLKSKDAKDVEVLGVLFFGPRSIVESHTGDFARYS